MVAPDLVGRKFLGTQTQRVNQQDLISFATSIGENPDTQISQLPTFPIRYTLNEAERIAPELGLDWSRVVHGDQRFIHYRFLKVDEEVRADSEIESVKSMAGNDILTLRSDLFVGEELVTSTWSTLVFRGQQ